MIIPCRGQLPLGVTAGRSSPVNTLAALRGALRRYCGGGTTGAPSTAAACHGQRGSHRKRARHRDEVRVTGGNDCLRLRRLGDQADGHRAMRRSRGGLRATKALDSQARVESFARGETPPLDVSIHRSRARRAGARIDRLVERTAAVDPVGGRQAHAERPSHGPGATNGVEHFERERMRLSNDPPYASVRHWRSATGIRAAGSRAPCAARVRRCRAVGARARWRRMHRVSPQDPAHRARPAAPHAARAASPMAQRASSRRRRAE